ncbi:S1C family serine protease [Rubritalea tangerina]|uniref:S1C family serine protease n=1 Tax=Rubritalea tangerina TaxID=430798 RepID=A0ABW4Z9U0_9BACT
MRTEDQKVLGLQADQFFKAIEPLSKEAGKHAVNVFSNGRMVSRGTVTKEGILTKWSELVSKGDRIWVVGHDGSKHEAFVKAVYLEYDLALLDYGSGLPAVDLGAETDLNLGEFLLAVGPAKDAHGFGVVSVLPRSLRESDKAFLGVRMDFNPVSGGGVRLESVERGSAAARAGLRPGDVVTQVNGIKVNGLHEMGNNLQTLRPGDQVGIQFLRDGKAFQVDVVLGARPELKQYSPQRMKQMKRMGGAINEVAEGFPEVLQSDMQVDAIDAGSPVFDLDGRFVGIIVARASRIKTYIVPADKIIQQLEKEPDMTASMQKQAQLIEQRRSGLSAAEAQEIRRLREMIQRAERRILEIESRP